MTDEATTAELLARDGNRCLVRIPGRKHSALAIQGDSLKVLQSNVLELAQAMAEEDWENARFSIDEVSAAMDSLIASYEGMSRQVGSPLPYQA
ncbi:hypothetical protein [Streptacidiphilus sp. P02-A3a]|uniref:DUF6959 family protein n=1 Tax=Streptacidiphilus sp. P02-A3a TaxID=2704468 RepID=UPI0015FB22FA|nr:hypothetical protein [Streptacidiphilus sp. P02-A3a]QMU69866.1 hypothetical protein GXP74_18240 [Streptacidiphilus sp. P02-A3a]